MVSHSSQMLSADSDEREGAREATKERCLVVLDPISLLHKSVYQHLVTNWGLQGKANAFVIGLAPCAYQMHIDFQRVVPPVAERMKSLLEGAYRKFAQPFEPEDQCVLEVGHHDQLARWVQVAADRIIADSPSPLLNHNMNARQRERVMALARAAPGASVATMGRLRKRL